MEGRRSAWEGLYTKRTERSRYEIKRKRGGERRERREGGREERERGREERELMVATWRLQLLFTQGTVLGVLTSHEISKAQCWVCFTPHEISKAQCWVCLPLMRSARHSVGCAYPS